MLTKFLPAFRQLRVREWGSEGARERSLLKFGRETDENYWVRRTRGGEVRDEIKENLGRILAWVGSDQRYPPTYPAGLTKGGTIVSKRDTNFVLQSKNKILEEKEDNTGIVPARQLMTLLSWWLNLLELFVQLFITDSVWNDLSFYQND